MSKKYYISIIGIFLYTFSFSQNIFFSKDIENINLLLDKNIYLAGEDIWLQIDYTLDKEYNYKQLSNIVYIEVFNKLGGSIIKKKFQIINNNVQGKIEIPEETIPGNYFVRAYTNYMRNFSPDNYFYDVISIYNPDKPFPKYADNSEKQDLQVFNIGQTIIKNIDIDFVLKLNNNLKINADKILLCNNSGDILTNIEFYKNGLASFKLKYLENTDYFFKIFTKKKDTLIYKFPEFDNKNKFYFTIKNKDNIFNLGIFCNQKEITGDNFKLIIKNNKYKTVYKDEYIDILNTHNRINIPKNDQLKYGIYYFYLTNNENDIVSSFAYFFPKNSKLEKSKVSLNKYTFSKNEKININIQTDALCKYNISVVKKGTFKKYSKLIPEYLVSNPFLIKSFLKNKFINNKPITSQINLVLCVNNNKLKNNISLENNHQENFIPDIRNVSVTGVIKDKTNNKPIKNIDICASTIINYNQINIKKTDSLGSFIFSFNNVFDKQEILISTAAVKNKDIEILIKNDFSQEYPKYKDIPLRLDSSLIKLITELYINKQINNLFPKENSKTIYPKLQAVNFSNIKISITLSNFIELPNMKEVINEIIPFATIQKKKDNIELSIYNPELKTKYHSPLVLIDYMPIFDYNLITKINPKLIDKIEVINNIYYLGDYTAHGILLIHSKKHNFAGLEFPKNSVYFKFETTTTQSYPICSSFNENNMPNFKNLLFFDSGKFNSNTYKSHFYSSHHLSDYEVVIRLFNENNISYNILEFSVINL